MRRSMAARGGGTGMMRTDVDTPRTQAELSGTWSPPATGTGWAPAELRQHAVCARPQQAGAAGHWAYISEHACHAFNLPAWPARRLHSGCAGRSRWGWASPVARSPVSHPPARRRRREGRVFASTTITTAPTTTTATATGPRLARLARPACGC